MGVDVTIEIPSVLKEEELFGPPAEMVALREERPVWCLRYHDGRLGWLVFDQARARVVLHDPRFSINPGTFAIDDGGYEAVVAQFANPGDFARHDPPEHTRLRKTLTFYFTVRAVAERRPTVEQIVASRLDAMEAEGPPVDFVQAFALPVPSMTICNMLGVPDTDSPRFEQPSRAVVSTSTTFEEKQAALDHFYRYVRSVIAEKRTRPDEGLISQLLERGELTDDELAGIILGLFDAGHATTARTFAFATFYLLYEPGRWQSVQAGAAAMNCVVEELFRYLPGLFRTGLPARTALEDVDLDGFIVKAGEPVTVYPDVMHRDPCTYSDPDRFDPSRDASGHMFFGFGRHMCLGQHVARLELEVGLTALTRRFPNLHLAIPRAEVPIVWKGFLYGAVKELPVAW
jgi:cytochrome P450